jgi:hypothetical protein
MCKRFRHAARSRIGYGTPLRAATWIEARPEAAPSAKQAGEGRNVSLINARDWQLDNGGEQRGFDSCRRQCRS